MAPTHRSALFVLPFGALVAGLAAGAAETWLHVSQLPETRTHFADLVLVAGLVDHTIALALGFGLWLAIRRVRRRSLRTQVATILSAQPVGLVAAGALYW